MRRWIMESSWNWAPSHRLQLFALRQDDGSRTEAPEAGKARARRSIRRAPDLVGRGGDGRVRARARRRPGLLVRPARVRGSESTVAYEALCGESEAVEIAQHDVRGHAFDIGITWLLAAPGEPRLFAGYARGSGDAVVVDGDGEEVEDGVDHSFRQPRCRPTKPASAACTFRTTSAARSGSVEPSGADSGRWTQAVAFEFARPGRSPLSAWKNPQPRWRGPARNRVDRQERDLGRAFIPGWPWRNGSASSSMRRSAFRSGDAFVTSPASELRRICRHAHRLLSRRRRHPLIPTTAPSLPDPRCGPAPVSRTPAAAPPEQAD